MVGAVRAGQPFRLLTSSAAAFLNEGSAKTHAGMGFA